MSFRGSSISEELWGVIETSGNLLAVGPAAARTRPPQRRSLPAPPRQFSRVATPRECLHASPATVQRGGPAHCGAWLVVAARGRPRCSRRGRCRRQSRPRGCATASTREQTRIHWRAWWRWWRWRRGATAGRACIWKACMEYVQKKKNWSTKATPLAWMHPPGGRKTQSVRRGRPAAPPPRSSPIQPHARGEAAPRHQRLDRKVSPPDDLRR